MNNRICFFINTLDNSGGTERVTTVLAGALVQQGYEVHIITWYGGEVSFYALDPAIQLHYIFPNRDGSIYKDYLNSLLRYRKLIRLIKPDFLVDVCVALSLLSIPAIAGLKVKLIAWEHFNTGVSWNPYTAKLSRMLAAKFAHTVVTLTDGDKQHYEHKFGARHVISIPNPVTLKPNGRADLQVKRVLAIGRFTPQKGFDLLLPIWKQVHARAQDWKLIMVGDGECRNEVMQLAESPGLADCVEFVPPSTNIAAYYLNASIYVMTSRFEGLPLVLIEAKAFGLPIVSYDCETGPRDIVRDQVDGVLVPHLDEAAFVESVLTLINNPQQRQIYAEEALQDVKRFNLEAVLASWNKLLR